jgi:hypothetical protein
MPESTLSPCQGLRIWPLGDGVVVRRELEDVTSPRCQSLIQHTDKKENQIFLVYKGIQNGAVAKSFEEGLPNICGNAQIFPHI